MFQLEPIAKLASESLYELYAARIQTDDGVGLVTARRLKPACVEAKGALGALRDAESMFSSLDPRFLLLPLGLFEGDGGYWWLSQRSLGFDLDTIIKRLGSREVRISPVNALQIGVDFLQGLSSIHELGEPHGGIIPANIIVDLDGTTRLDGAFFEGMLLKEKDLRKMLRKGHTSYLAPELSQTRAQDTPGDVFAAAAVLYHLLAGRPPLDNVAGMSTRHQAIKPPSKVDRSLPYSCDAVFVKALASAPRQRHDSAQALSNAISRLRKSLLVGADKARASVSEFLKNLYPNEAKVLGMPGTLERPAISKPVALYRMGAGTLAMPAIRNVDTEPLAKPLGTQSNNIVGPSASPGDEPKSLGFPEKAQPLDGSRPKNEDDEVQTEEGAPNPLRFAAGASNQQTQPLAKLNPLSGTMTDREETALNRPADLSPSLDLPSSVPAPKVLGEDTDELSEDISLDEQTGQGEEQYFQSAQDRTGAESSEPKSSSQETSIWRRPSFLVAAALVGITLIALVLLLSGVFSAKGKLEAFDQAKGQTSLIGFLSLNAKPGFKVIMDGEQLAEAMPLVRKVVRAGTHRLQVFTRAGVQLMDEKVLVQAGEHKEIKLVYANTPGPASVTKKPADKIHKLRSSSSRIKKKKYHSRTKRKRSKSRYRRKRKKRKRTRG